MSRLGALCTFVLVVSGSLAFLSGCSGTPTILPASSPNPKSPSNPNPSGASGSITQPSVYVVDDSGSVDIVRVFPKTATGEVAKESADIPGEMVSVDDAGNIYVFGPNTGYIAEYALTSSGISLVRTIPLGGGRKVSGIVDMVADAKGDIFVSDGKGIAVFGPATGNTDVDPVRYISGVIKSADGTSTPIVPGLIAVDRSANLYVQNTLDNSVVVFGPTDNGTVAPSRRIAGQLTNLTGDMDDTIFAMTTDYAGNLYALCFSASPDDVDHYWILEFAPDATGNIAPTRYVSSPEMNPWTGGNGLAVDSAGTIYVSAGTSSGVQTVFEFSADASGSVAPSNTVTLAGWTDSPNSRIAVNP